MGAPGDEDDDDDLLATASLWGHGMCSLQGCHEINLPTYLNVVLKHTTNTLEEGGSCVLHM